MSERPICNYEGSRYRTEFWTDARSYEDAVERVALRALLPPQGKVLMEVGAGFGRLADLYTGYETVVIFDYAKTQLEQALVRLQGTATASSPRYIFVQGNFYQFPFVDGLFDAITTIRTLHHAADAPSVLQGIAAILGPGGHFILEFANKQNLKAIARYGLRKQTWSPFERKPTEFIALNFDFHPQWVGEHLERAGLRKEKVRTVSHFRMDLLKRYIPTSILVALDILAQTTGNLWQLSPSVFVRAHAGKGKASATPGAFFACPACGAHLGSPQQEKFICICGKTWQKEDGIYNFRDPV